MTNLASSAPHVTGACDFDDLVDWGAQPDAISGASHSTGQLLFKGPDNIPESGIWDCTPGHWRLQVPRDEFCHFVKGRARYTSDAGEVIDVTPGTCVLFPAGWSGEAEIFETIRNIYMLSSFDADLGLSETPLMRAPLNITDTVDWGIIPTMIEGQSHVSGVVLHKGPKAESECGLWRCTPGKWDCHVTSDEFCHFLEGRCTYVHQSGDVIEVTPDTAAFFPKDWKGVCTVHETIKKVYMIR